MALTALAEQRAHVTLVSADPYFRYRPAATAEPFGDEPPLVYDLRALVEGLGASYVPGRVSAVAPKARWLHLTSGRRLSYDALILAIGAGHRAGVPGAITFRDQRDVPRLRQVLLKARYAGASRLTFAVPSRRSWSLPAALPSASDRNPEC